jgi:hypothetical protein
MAASIERLSGVVWFMVSRATVLRTRRRMQPGWLGLMRVAAPQPGGIHSTAAGSGGFTRW